jgi:hypothetical protein
MGAESDFTPKSKFVPGDFFYKFENIKKIMEVRKYLFQGSKLS